VNLKKGLLAAAAVFAVVHAGTAAPSVPGPRQPQAPLPGCIANGNQWVCTLAGTLIQGPTPTVEYEITARAGQPAVGSLSYRSLRCLLTTGQVPLLQAAAAARGGKLKIFFSKTYPTTAQCADLRFGYWR